MRTFRQFTFAFARPQTLRRPITATAASWRSGSQSKGYGRPLRLGLLAASALAAAPSVFYLRAEEQPESKHASGEAHQQLDQLPAERAHQQETRKRSWLRCLFNSIDWLILEPLSTLRRFIFLALLFLPVIVTCPLLLRQALPHQQDPPSVRWWYGLLVKQMERAGPTFIKVRDLLQKHA